MMISNLTVNLGDELKLNRKNEIFDSSGNIQAQVCP